VVLLRAIWYVHPEEKTITYKVGLTGGITKAAEECKSTELKNGMGATIYYFVDNIEKVRSSLCIFSC
jgi:hypothetical protein